jgi:uncharacterized membrane protein
LSDKSALEKLKNTAILATNGGNALPPRFSSYLKNIRATWYWLTIATAVTTVIAVFSIPDGFYPWIYFRNILGAIFVLWLPGYALTKLLFLQDMPVKTSTKNLETVERIALSIGVSLAIVPLIGLLLNYSPWGIRLVPIVLSLLAFTVVIATAAVIRDYLTTLNTKA